MYDREVTYLLLHSRNKNQRARANNRHEVLTPWAS